MDAMALLCNLHADGPATLRRLRAFGVGTLQDLHDREVAELARLLEVSPAQARRFVREADQLRERLGPDAWDQEEGEEVAPAFDGNAEGLESLPPEPRTVPIPSGVRERAPHESSAGHRTAFQPEKATPVSPASDFAASASSAPSSEPVTSTPAPQSDSPQLESDARPAGAVLAGEAGEDSTGRLSARDRELLDQVLRRWRGGAKPQASPAAAQEEPTLERSLPASSLSSQAVSASAAESASATPAGDDADWLTTGRLSGLGIPQIEKLELAGVRTFTALANCDPLSLSKTSGLTFSTLQRLKFLAARAPKTSAAAASSGASVERLSRSERPPVLATADAEGEPSVGTLMEALSPRQPRPGSSADRQLETARRETATESVHSSPFSSAELGEEEPSLADLLPHEDEGPGGPFA